MKDVQGPFIAWYQGQFSRVLVEIESTPRWEVPLPYDKNWRRPIWTVEIREVAPTVFATMTATNGVPMIEVRHLHPLNTDTKELLALRLDKPPSPFVTPKVPQIMHGDLCMAVLV